jgi:hypothetical protein
MSLWGWLTGDDDYVSPNYWVDYGRTDEGYKQYIDYPSGKVITKYPNGWR